MAGAAYPAIIHANKTPANFFQRIFGVVPDFQETIVYEPNFAVPIFCFCGGKIGKRGSNFGAFGAEAVGQTRFGR